LEALKGSGDFHNNSGGVELGIDVLEDFMITSSAERMLAVYSLLTTFEPPYDALFG
jgi:hypothetical protein